MWNAPVLQVVTMKDDLRRRFYHAVVFLCAITRACENNRRPVPHDLSWHPNDPLDKTFKDFVNRLCQFCDVKRGGDTVTAATVLELKNGIQYRFACNRRNPTQLSKARDYVIDLLGTLRDATSTDADLRFRLLSKVLGFCRDRVQFYLRHLKDASRACIGTGPAEVEYRDQLRRLEEATRHDDFDSLDDDACKCWPSRVHSRAQSSYSSPSRQPCRLPHGYHWQDSAVQKFCPPRKSCTERNGTEL